MSWMALGWVALGLALMISSVWRAGRSQGGAATLWGLLLPVGLALALLGVLLVTVPDFFETPETPGTSAGARDGAK